MSDSGAGRRRTVRIGITGPIGCGKSTLTGWLGELGAAVIDAAVLAREVVEPGEPALDAVINAFGADLRRPDGTLDRAALGRIVFDDPGALDRLEAIVHPAVRPRVLAAVASAEKAGAPAVVIEAIALVEGGLAALCDEVWLGTCAPVTQQLRLTERGLALDESARRRATQGDIRDRLAPAATRLIDTSGTIAETRAAVGAAWREAQTAVRR